MLAAGFSLPPGRGVKQLSRGMCSILGIVIGLAARAEVTLFDEPNAGLDPVARQMFYDRMLADHAVHPRAILLSTPLIDAAADQVRTTVPSVTGPAIGVADFAAGRTIRDRRRLGSRAAAVVVRALDDTDQARTWALRLRPDPLTLQQVVAHAAGNLETDARERTSA
jgi:ABC-2 type transport system ATP-binding protein